ncbi:MAG: sigma-54 interaction domain-containing protein [bacterium]
MGHDPKIIELLELVVKIKDADLPVLIEGESGTGKELVARALHFISKRREFPLIDVNCGAIPENLMETEFFGYEKGAFTGAVNSKMGKFEAASHGTLFLDEIEEMSLDLQVKLLRVIQWGEFTPVGGVKPKKTEARIIAASNRDLRRLVQEGKFRHDLFYRLNVLRLEVPPLRERRQDIPVLCQHFLKRDGAKFGFPEVKISDSALRALASYDFPGNVRELENLIIRAILIANGETIQIHHFPVEISSKNSNGDLSEDVFEWPFAKAKERVVSAFEMQYVTHKLREYHGVVLQAAKSAGMFEANFRRKMEKYGIVSERVDARKSTLNTRAEKLEYTSQKA